MKTRNPNFKKGVTSLATASWRAAALRRFSADPAAKSARGLAHSKTCRNSKSGILLIDCIVYIGLFFLIMAVAFSYFYSCWDGSLALRRNTEDITRALKAGELWRADVRGATGAIRVEDSPDGQLVRIPQKSGEVVYEFSKGSLSRITASHEPRLLLPKVKTSRMEVVRRGMVTAWRWEIELPSKIHRVRTRPLFTFEAVPSL